jgi:hypothetical protein
MELLNVECLPDHFHYYAAFCSSSPYSLINSWSGTEKKQEGCCTEMGSAILGTRKNPRTEHAIIEDFLGTKKQRTTGAFGESSLVRYWIWFLLKLVT